jgi:hypothetical protein
VFEEMGKPGFSRLDFIPRPGADDCVVRNDVRIVERNGDDFKPVFQLLDLVVIRKDLRAVESRGYAKEKENGESEGDEFSHFYLLLEFEVKLE